MGLYLTDIKHHERLFSSKGLVFILLYFLIFIDVSSFHFTAFVQGSVN